ncbi:hypothetical protein BDZ85DRAFT_260550 [Elsinoe ampelina]|uniref:Uncharacterized protein n=1 Tax=Elsinoe ampelina TaxID=302913 RepID=A0A6A6GEZ4_9PEZI|nr:hypothetical protein BDZ85DRAFT_260550 [Elsinoe ampelina]
MSIPRTISGFFIDVKLYDRVFNLVNSDIVTIHKTMVENLDVANRKGRYFAANSPGECPFVMSPLSFHIVAENAIRRRLFVTFVSKKGDSQWIMLFDDPSIEISPEGDVWSFMWSRQSKLVVDTADMNVSDDLAFVIDLRDRCDDTWKWRMRNVARTVYRAAGTRAGMEVGSLQPRFPYSDGGESRIVYEGGLNL